MSTAELAPVVVGLAVGIALVVMFSVMLPPGFSTPDDDSKSSGKVVFSGAVNRNVTHQIYIVDLDGTDLTNLTNDSLWHFEPVSAPDGTKIAYVSWNSFPNAPANGKLMQDLYVVNADGTNKKLLSRNCQNDHHVGRHVWSPDGTMIAFEGENDLFVVNVDGSMNCIRLAIGDAHLTEFQPVWASNERIFFTSVLRNGSETLSSSLNEIKIDGSGLKTLFNYDDGKEGFYLWSPDLRKISFIHINDELSASLYVMNADGSNRTRLADSPPLSFSNRKWSPNGREVAFEHWTGDFQDIYVIDINDGSMRRLSNGSAFDGNPVWSLDGQKIAFTRMSEGKVAYYVMNADDGSGQIKLAEMEASIVNVPSDWLS